MLNALPGLAGGAAAVIGVATGHENLQLRLAVRRIAVWVEGGEVTSGSLSPMLEVGIGMGYVPTELAAPGTRLTIDVRGRLRAARTVKKPIYERKE